MIKLTREQVNKFFQDTLGSYERLYGAICSWINEYQNLNDSEYEFKGLGKYDSETGRINVVLGNGYKMFAAQFDIEKFFTRTPKEQYEFDRYTSLKRCLKFTEETVAMLRENNAPGLEEAEKHLNNMKKKIREYEINHNL